MTVKPNKKCCRGSKKRNHSNLVLFGVNCNGIRKKLDSLGTILVDENPSVIFLQETHFTNVGQIKTTNSEKYIWFELIRQEARLGGGGLAMGCLSDLKPIKTREGDDETECLTIEITVGECKMMVVNGYGPQLSDKIERKIKFWEYLEEEVLRADQLEMPIVIQH